MNCVVIIFSRDRALQLDATLRSFLLHCQDAGDSQIRVLYATSGKAPHSEQYRRLEEEFANYPFLRFVRENDFRSDCIALPAAFDHVCFLVDDNLFVRDFSLAQCLRDLEVNPQALGYSLRLGRNTTYCYPFNCYQRPPTFRPSESSALIFRWTDGDLDFGYPLELSSSIYRIRDLLPFLTGLTFSNPNHLEAAMDEHKDHYRDQRPLLLCAPESITFCAPMNKVQSICPNNRVSGLQEYTADRLAQLFDQGYRINVDSYAGFRPNACHQEVEYRFRSGGNTLPLCNGRPLVSVIIPCYNQAEFLPDAVESVVHQTFTDWECIIVNDGSPDQTSQVARDLIARYPGKRIRLLEKKNGGLADARNAGIADSHGRYILPLDADDALKPFALARLVEVLETQSDVAIVYPDYETFGTQSCVIRCIDEHLFFDAARLKNGLPSCSGLPYCSLYRRDVWSKVGGYNPNMIWGYEDWDFWIGCLDKGFKARRVPESLFLYRVKPGSMYSNALKHDAELKARIILNHSALFDEAVRQEAATVLQAPVTPGLSAVERPPQEIPADTQPTAVPSPPEASDSKWPPEVTAYVRQADEQFCNGNLVAARDAVSQALAILPNDPQLILTYGNVVLQLGDVEGSRREFVKAATLHPNHSPAHLNLAAVLFMLGRTQEAEASVRRALALNATDADALKLLGRLCMESGGAAEATEAYASALRQRPNDVETLLALGKCAAEAGESSSAHALYERVLQIDGSNKTAKEGLAFVKRQTSTTVHASITMPGDFQVSQRGELSERLEGLSAASLTGSLRSDHGAPKVSVIVPTYNRPDTLLDALRSILNQTYQDFEIIVVNDGGSDIENIVRFIDKDGRITYIKHGKNRNLAAARNTGIRVARGKYIAYLDDDDLYHPDHLQTLVTFLEQSECKVAYTDAYRAHQEKRDGRYVVTKRDIPYSFDFDYDRILVHNFVPVLCFMHERACLDAVGLFDESLTTHEDWELWIRLSRRFQFAHIKKVTCEFASRTDGSTMSSSKLADFRRTYTIILERYKASAVEKPHIRATQERLLQRMRGGTASTDVATQSAWSAEVIERVRQAEQHLVQGDPPAAQHALCRALELAPHDPELIVAHGNILLRVGDVEGARREFVKATVLAPEYVPAHSNLAAVLLHLGRAEDAEASARQALALNPADTDSLKVLARVCLDGERFAEAVQAYVAVLRLHPDDVETLLVVGNCYAEAGRPEEATTFYQRVLQLDPGNAIAADNLAVVNGKEYEVPAPISIAARATNDRVEVSSRQETATTLSYQPVSADSGDAQMPPAWPANVIEQVRLADQHVLAGDLPAAQHALSQALNLVPNDPELIVVYGNILLRAGDVEAARREFLKATVLAPEDAAAHSSLAAVLLHLGRAEDAETSARRALALNQNDTDALKILARLCLDSERYTEAVQAYVAVLRLHPDDVETLLLVGNCYAEAGRPEEATTFYQRVLQLDSGNAIAADNLAVVNSKERASDLAISTGLPVCCTPTSSELSDGEPVPVSIIIPVFNCLELTRQCLESIRRTSPVGLYEIVVVDNGSIDGTSDFLRQQQQAGHLRVIFNSDNRGFAGACNQGARAAKSDYLLFLNNDTVPQAGWLEPLCEVLDRDQSVAAVGSKLLFPDGTLQHVGVIVVLDERRPSSPLSPRHSDYKQPDHPETNRMRTFQVLTAACLLIRRIALEQAGGFDEGYWNGYEDVDLCFALQAQGWKLVYRPESVLIHHESQSGPERHVKEDENLIRLNQRWLAKCEPDCIVKRDGSIIRTDAGRIQMYTLPTEASPTCLQSPIDSQTGTNISGSANQKDETAKPVASIIIVTYNSASTIRDCLDSVFSCASARIEVIVVDNASTDDTRAILAEHKERLTILEHSDNLGFSLACNQGIRASSGEYVVLLNPDTVVTQGWLERMKAHFGQDVGAVGPVSNYVAALQNIDRHRPVGAPRRMGLLEVTDLLARVNHGKGLEARLLTGFCMMIPRRVLDEIGLLDEALFLGNDDLDLSWRLREKGYRLLVATDTFVHHKGQVSFKSEPSARTTRLVQESTDHLYAKLEGHYGPGNVPSPMELWGIDWFKPTTATSKTAQPSSTPTTPLPRKSPPPVSSPSEGGGLGRGCEPSAHEVLPEPRLSVPGLTSIIILTHNGLEHTKKCLASIEAHTPEPHLLIIVDNASTDGTLDYLRNYMAAHDNVRVVANRANRGFAAGNNQGLALARGDYVLLLNNDTIMTQGWLRRMVAVLERHPEVGIIGPMSNYVSGPQLVRDASYKGPEGLGAFAAEWARCHDGQSAEATRVVGFCLLTRKEVITRIGGLDEQFGSGNFEDDDFCIRAFQVGFRARIALDVFIHHTGSQTFKSAKIDYRQSLMRNWELFKAKWGIPADAPYEKGYRFPSQTPQGSDLSIPLPDVGAGHRCEDQGRWWQEISERPGRSQSAMTEEAPLSVVIVPNGQGLAPLWPSLVQHTKHPLAITILPSHGNGNGADPVHDVTCPDDWRISASDFSAVRFLNQLLQSAHDDPFLLLSSDLILTPGWLKRLLAAFDRDRRIAVVGPTLNQGPAIQRIKAEYKGTGKSLRQFALRRAHRYGGELAEVDSLAPFCLLFSRTACRAIGPLREDLNLAASLLDYFARLRQADRTVAVALDAYAHWEESPSPASLRGSA